MNLHLREFPAAPQLGVRDSVQSFLRGNSDPTVTVFFFADKVLHNLTPRVLEGEFWESIRQQDSVALFLCLECKVPESLSRAPVLCPFTGPTYLLASTVCSPWPTFKCFNVLVSESYMYVK